MATAAQRQWAVQLLRSFGAEVTASNIEMVLKAHKDGNDERTCNHVWVYTNHCHFGFYECKKCGSTK